MDAGRGKERPIIPEFPVLERLRPLVSLTRPVDDIKNQSSWMPWKRRTNPTEGLRRYVIFSERDILKSNVSEDGSLEIGKFEQLLCRAQRGRG